MKRKLTAPAAQVHKNRRSQPSRSAKTGFYAEQYQSYVLSTIQHDNTYGYKQKTAINGIKKTSQLTNNYKKPLPITTDTTNTLDRRSETQKQNTPNKKVRSPSNTTVDDGQRKRNLGIFYTADFRKVNPQLDNHWQRGVPLQYHGFENPESSARYKGTDRSLHR